jgi:hypothetical protein
MDHQFVMKIEQMSRQRTIINEVLCRLMLGFEFFGRIFGALRFPQRRRDSIKLPRQNGISLSSAAGNSISTPCERQARAPAAARGPDGRTENHDRTASKSAKKQNIGEFSTHCDLFQSFKAQSIFGALSILDGQLLKVLPTE